MKNKLFILLWEYTDHSSAGIAAASHDEETLKIFLDLLSKHGDACKTFRIEEIAPSPSIEIRGIDND